jgi:prophage regulatory protein
MERPKKTLNQSSLLLPAYSGVSPNDKKDGDAFARVRFVRYADLKARGISYSNVHLLKLEADGKFPRRVFLSPARVVWIESEIDDYIARCIAARG